MSDPRDTTSDSEGILFIRYPRTDFPQQGWLYKPIVDGTTGDLYEARTDFGWFRSTQGENEEPTKRLINYAQHSRVYDFYQTQPLPVWPSDVFPDAWLIPADRMAKGHTYFTSQWEDTSWNYTSIPVVFDPTQLSWSLDSQRHKVRPYWTAEWTGTDWLYTSIPTFDAAQQSWQLDSQRPSARKYWTAGWTDTSWTEPSDRPREWNIESQYPAKRRYWTSQWDDTSWTEPSDRPHEWGIDSQYPAKRKYWTNQWDDTSWNYPTLPVVFDPSQQSWSLDSQHPNLRRYWTSEWPSTGWLGDGSQQSWVIDSQRVHARPYRSYDWIDTSWIYPTLPVVFDPAIQSWMVDSFRPAARPTDLRWRVIHPTWHTTKGDGSREDWSIQSARPAKRSTRPSSEPFSSFSFPIVPFDPVLGSRTVQTDRLSSRRTYLYDAAVRRPDGIPLQPWTISSDRPLARARRMDVEQPNVGWLYTATTAFDPASQSWAISSDRSTRRSALRVHNTPIQHFSFPVVPVDPAIRAWGIPADRHDARRLYRYDSGIWQAEFRATNTWTIQSDRPTTRRMRWTVDQPDAAWLYTSAQVFDPARQSWTIFSTRTLARQWRTAESLFPTWTVPSVVFDPRMAAAVTISAQRMGTRPVGRWQATVEPPHETPPAPPGTVLRQRTIRGNAPLGQDDWTISYLS